MPSGDSSAHWQKFLISCEVDYFINYLLNNEDSSKIIRNWNVKSNLVRISEKAICIESGQSVLLSWGKQTDIGDFNKNDLILNWMKKK
jgi:hypothetical protein